MRLCAWSDRRAIHLTHGSQRHRGRFISPGLDYENTSSTIFDGMVLFLLYGYDLIKLRDKEVVRTDL
jgi:hypothetical protein